MINGGNLAITIKDKELNVWKITIKKLRVVDAMVWLVAIIFVYLQQNYGDVTL